MPTLAEPITDVDLWADCRAGSSEALAELYDRFASPLLAYLLSLTADRDAAEEVLQQVFVEVLRLGPALPQDRRPSAYLFASARNRAANLVRESQARQRALFAYELLARQKASGCFAGDETLEQELLARLNSGLRWLSEGEREAILLHTQGELTFQEIARITGEPQGTVATRYRTGLEKLRGYLSL